MIATLKKGLEELSKLPESDQVYLAEQLERWRKLRSSIDEARSQVAAGDVAPFDADDIIRKARAQYAGT